MVSDRIGFFAAFVGELISRRALQRGLLRIAAGVLGVSGVIPRRSDERSEAETTREAAAEEAEATAVL